MTIVLVIEHLFRGDPQHANCFPLHIYQSRIRCSLRRDSHKLTPLLCVFATLLPLQEKEVLCLQFVFSQVGDYWNKTMRLVDILVCRWVCFGDRLADQSPIFYCEQCYQPLHHSENGELLYDDFEVYAYQHE